MGQGQGSGRAALATSCVHLPSKSLVPLNLVGSAVTGVRISTTSFAGSRMGGKLTACGKAIAPQAALDARAGIVGTRDSGAGTGCGDTTGVDCAASVSGTEAIVADTGGATGAGVTGAVVTAERSFKASATETLVTAALIMSIAVGAGGSTGTSV